MVGPRGCEVVEGESLGAVPQERAASHKEEEEERKEGEVGGEAPPPTFTPLHPALD